MPKPTLQQIVDRLFEEEIIIGANVINEDKAEVTSRKGYIIGIVADGSGWYQFEEIG